MKLGANSVLFGGHRMETAFECIAMAGYDGIELSAIDGMSEHLVLERWRELVPLIRDLSQAYGLELLAIEQPSHDRDKMEHACAAAAALGIPVVNCGPGGKTGDEESLRASIASLSALAEIAEAYGVVLCVKAHYGASIHDTATTLRAMEVIPSPAFGIDMDPSHVHRAGENPVEAIVPVISRVRHVHVRDCKGRQGPPGPPELQANGRGDIDLLGFIRVLHEHGYDGAPQPGDHRRPRIRPPPLLRHSRRGQRPPPSLPPSLRRPLIFRIFRIRLVLSSIPRERYLLSLRESRTGSPEGRPLWQGSGGAAPRFKGWVGGKRSFPLSARCYRRRTHRARAVTGNAVWEIQKNDHRRYSHPRRA